MATQDSIDIAELWSGMVVDEKLIKTIAKTLDEAMKTGEFEYSSDDLSKAHHGGAAVERIRMRKTIIAEYEYWRDADEQTGGVMFTVALGAIANLLAINERLLEPRKRKAANDESEHN